MKRLATGFVAAVAAFGMSGAYGAQASALASDVTFQVVNTDPANTSPPDYAEAVLLTDVDATVDGQIEYNAPETCCFMATLSDASPPSPDASSSASVSGGNTMSTAAFSTGLGSAQADAGSGGGGALILGAGETMTFSMTLQLTSSASPGEYADALTEICFALSCDTFDANDTTRTIAYSRSYSNTSGDYETLLLSLGMSSIVSSVPEPASGGLLFAGLGMLGWMASRRRRALRP